MNNYITGIETYLEYNGLDLGRQYPAMTSDNLSHTNLITNPSFEVDTNGWISTSPSNTSLERSSVWAYSGGYSAYVKSLTTAIGATRSIRFVLSSGFSVGDTITASCRANIISNGSVGTRMSLEYKQSDGTTSAGTTTNGSDATGTGEKSISVTGTIPANCAIVWIVISLRGDVTADVTSLYVDAISAFAGETTDYFDGDTLHCQWTGVAHNSTSTKHSISKNAERYVVTEIDGLHDADIRDDREVNPGSHGETAFNAFYGGRTITISGYIRANNIDRLREMQVELRRAFASLDEMPLYFRHQDSSYDTYISCRKSQPIAMRDSQTSRGLQREFLITLRSSDPRVYSASEDLVTINPNVAPETSRSYDKTFSYTYPAAGASYALPENLGSFPTEPVYRFIGPFSSPEIHNFTNNKSMILNASLTSSANYFEIDVRRKTIVDENGTNRFSVLDPTSEWVDLDEGVNDIRFVATSPGTGCTLQVYYRHAWL